MTRPRSSEVEKPPYRVPLMSELYSDEWPDNGLRVASTFSGAGGSCLGYRMAGMRVLWANEFEKSSIASYKTNHTATVLDERDIRTVHGQDIIDAVGPVDLFDGSPPCQSFSGAGRRHHGWGETLTHSDGTVQISDDLFFEYARILGELRPRAFIAENVRGLVQGVSKGYFKEIFARLVDQGYEVRARILDAQWMGVPQARKRVVFIGLRDDLHAVPTYPEPNAYRYSILDACPWLGDAEVGFRQGGWKGMEDRDMSAPAPTVMASRNDRGHNRVRVVADPSSSTLAPDGSLRYPPIVRDGEGPSSTIVAAGARQVRVATRGRFNTDEDRNFAVDGPSPTIGARGMSGSAGPHAARLQTHDDTGTKGFGGRRVASLADPAPTIMAGSGSPKSNSHPKLQRTGHDFEQVDQSTDEPAPTITAHGRNNLWTEERSLSIDEVKRLCSFPDDFILEGSYAQQWARLGNSVPPLMMRSIAEAIGTQLLGLA